VKDTLLGTVDETLSTGRTSGMSGWFYMTAVEVDVVVSESELHVSV